MISCHMQAFSMPLLMSGTGIIAGCTQKQMELPKGCSVQTRSGWSCSVLLWIDTHVNRPLPPEFWPIYPHLPCITLLFPLFGNLYLLLELRQNFTHFWPGAHFLSAYLGKKSKSLDPLPHPQTSWDPSSPRRLGNLSKSSVHLTHMQMGDGCGAGFPYLRWRHWGPKEQTTGQGEESVGSLDRCLYQKSGIVFVAAELFFQKQVRLLFSFGWWICHRVSGIRLLIHVPHIWKMGSNLMAG